MRAVVFSLSAAVLLLSTMGIGLDAAFSRGGYGCMGAPSLILLPFLAISGLVSLTLAAGRVERVPAAVVVVLGMTASAIVLSRPYGYRQNPEAVALGDIRTVLSGQAAYQGVNNGYYDSLECLSRPSSCIPGYAKTGPTFLDLSLAQPEPSGEYRRWLVPGAPVTGAPPTASRTSIRTFAYFAVPVDSRMRSFCGDDTGVIFQAPDGITPNIRDAQCDDPRFTALK